MKIQTRKKIVERTGHVNMTKPTAKAGGVSVLTKYPVFVNKKIVANKAYEGGFRAASPNTFSKFDGSDYNATVKFQTWYNANRKPSDPDTLMVDGVYGPLTTAAYQSATGKGYDAIESTIPAAALPGPAKVSTSAPAPVSGTGSPKGPVKADEKSALWSTSKKIAVFAGGGIVLLLIIVLANKNNRKAEPATA